MGISLDSLRSGYTELINIDKSGANKSAIKVYNKRAFKSIEIRQCKYLNNVIEQDHRMVKWRILNGSDFKSFESAKRTVSGIELVRMIKKGQLISQEQSMFSQFKSLAA